MLDGTMRGIEEGYFQGAIADSAYEFEKAVTSGERTIVGVNKHVAQDGSDLEILRIGEEIELGQRRRIDALRAARDDAAVQEALGRIRAEAADETTNLMPALLDAARVRATQGEMVEALKDVFGGYREPVRI